MIGIFTVAVFEPSQMQYRCLALGHIREDQIMPVTVKGILGIVLQHALAL